MEEWKDIDGYENKYQVSNLGRLKSVAKGIIMKPMITTNGYYMACLWKNNNQKKYCLHQLVAKAFLQNPESYSEVNHKDEDKTNNTVENLEWCTHKYNMNYGKIKEKISRSNTGKVAWNKGKKCPEITARQLGKPHPHGSTKKKKESE